MSYFSGSLEREINVYLQCNLYKSEVIQCDLLLVVLAFV